MGLWILLHLVYMQTKKIYENLCGFSLTLFRRVFARIDSQILIEFLTLHGKSFAFMLHHYRSLSEIECKLCQEAWFPQADVHKLDCDPNVEMLHIPLQP